MRGNRHRLQLRIVKRNGLDWHVWGWSTRSGVLLVGGSALVALNGVVNIRSFGPTDFWFWIHAALVVQGLWFFARLRTWRTRGDTHAIHVPSPFRGTREIPFGELRHAFIKSSGDALWLRLKDGELVETPIREGGAQHEIRELRDVINAQLGLPPGYSEPRSLEQNSPI